MNDLCHSTAPDGAHAEHGRIRAVDTHAHVFERHLPFAEPRRYTPAYDATLDDYLAQLDAHGISHGVLVQPSFLGSDCSYMLDALAQAPERLRGIAVIEPGCSQAYLDHLHEAGVVGIRLNLIGVPDLPLEQTVWQQTLAQVAALGWQVEIHAEAYRLAATVAPLLRHRLNVVIDHFGRPDPHRDLDDASLHDLYQLADTGRVWVKLSGAYRNASPGPDAAERIAARAQALLSRLKACFGLERLMWGSDWPHTNFEACEQYGNTVDFIRQLLPDSAARHIVMQQVPARLFGFSSR